jgi:hypothetical protein
MIIGAVLLLLFSVMIMLAVGIDCKRIGVKKRGTWMVLAFFVPITAIIYFCIRKKLEKTVPKYCRSCGATVEPNQIVCPNCGSAKLDDYVIAGADKKKKSIKICLIIGLVGYIAGVIFAYIGFYSFFITEFSKLNDYSSGYYDFDDDYDDYSDFYNYYGNDYYQIP